MRARFHREAGRCNGHGGVGEVCRLEANIFSLRSDDNVRHDHVGDCVAVRLRGVKREEADGAAATGLVNDPDIDAEIFFHTSLKPARLLIGPAAGRVRNDERDVMIRVTLRVGGAKRADSHGDTRDRGKESLIFLRHCFPPLHLIFQSHKVPKRGYSSVPTPCWREISRVEALSVD